MDSQENIIQRATEQSSQPKCSFSSGVGLPLLPETYRALINIKDFCQAGLRKSLALTQIPKGIHSAQPPFLKIMRFTH